ncbi:transcription-repair coupling factor [Patescibacteria group bacterium]|nr:transcription-repair coupling factor [Patescibacteria group bacterium]
MISQKQKKVNTTKFWLKLANELKSTETLHISGPPNDTARTYVLSQLTTPLSNQNGAIFWLCKDDNEAKSVYKNLKFWQNINKQTGFTVKLGFKTQPNWKTQANPQTKIHLLNPENHQQLSIINYQLSRPQTSQIIISTIDNLQYLNPNQEILNLKQNTHLNPQHITQKLVNLGYERNTVTDAPGTLAVRGSILDIWTPQLENPVRIELEFDKISSIKLFDPVNKKTKSSLEKVDVVPLTSRKHENIKALKQKNNETMKQLNNSLLIYTNPEQFEAETPNWQKLTQQIKNDPQIIFYSLTPDYSITQLPNYFSLNFRTPAPYHNNLNRFITGLKKYHDYQIIIATNQEKSLKQLFKEKNLILPNYSITRLPSCFITGFQSQPLKILFLTDLEIFGKPEAKKSTKNSSIKCQATQALSIKPGDYIVHIDHGIARFQGTAIQKVDNIKKEYFVLEYALGDKLYVPIELAQKIEKYIGLAQPHLHRLSGGMWYQAKRKIKEQAEKTAKELLELYAQREIVRVVPFPQKTPEEKELEDSFPYEETPDQTRTIREVEQDLEQEKPMDRLICGDVGFGKTEVAIRAALKAVMNNKQVALIAPTTILAQQHYDTFKQRLEKFPITTEVLSRFKSKSQAKKIIEKLKSRAVDIVIGTHRLLSGDMEFKNLGLIIIDEEQRFGVEHKEKLKKLRNQAHVLTLTATPIPRTLHLSLTGLRDVSIIETAPRGRKSIKTVIKQYNDNDVKNAIDQELKRGGQVYFVHNRVETINIMTNKLQKLLPNATLAIAHGQMPEEKLAQTMADFDNKKTDVLVCSTIIENGLDLPNVNTLIVDEATRFGLSQLYQLRGRVGRSDRQAYAYFFYRRLQPAGICNQSLQTRQGLTEKETKRLSALQEAEELGSGFTLAMRDLEIRGVGNILGKKQHGSVAAIGLSLYTRLLAQAVEEIKTGSKPLPITEVSIDLPLELGIPKSFEPSETKRLHLYQQLANINNLNELKKIRATSAKRDSLNIRNVKNNIRDGLAKKYSRKISESFQNLFQILEIKLLCQKASIINIGTTYGLSGGKRQKKIVVKFKENIDPQLILKLLDHNPYWKFSGNQIKIMISDLGRDWLGELKKCIMILDDKKIGPAKDHGA